MKFISLKIAMAVLFFFTLQGQTLISDNPEKLDPFKPLEISSDVSETLLSDTQKYDLSEFVLSGILLGKNLSALVITPKNVGVVVKIGDLIGKNQGKVIAINKENIVVRQYYTETLYRGKTKQIRKTHKDVAMLLVDKIKKSEELANSAEATVTPAVASSSETPTSVSSVTNHGTLSPTPSISNTAIDQTQNVKEGIKQ